MRVIQAGSFRVLLLLCVSYCCAPFFLMPPQFGIRVSTEAAAVFPLFKVSFLPPTRTTPLPKSRYAPRPGGYSVSCSPLCPRFEELVRRSILFFLLIRRVLVGSRMLLLRMSCLLFQSFTCMMYSCTLRMPPFLSDRFMFFSL
jgi:hypothetical protein